MPRSRDWPLRVQDMLEAIARIEEFCAGVGYDEFVADTMRSHAVRHNFGILGEAARAVPDAERARYPEVAWQQAGDMRNFVVHVYWLINDRIVWQTINTDLPVLKAQLEAILKREAAAED